MDNISFDNLCNGVEVCHIKTDKFKTSRISVNMFVKANEFDVSANALLTSLVTRASKEYPDLTSLNARLNELYGATLFGDAVKFGDMQLVKFVIAFLDDKYTLDNEKISTEAVDLLLSMLFNPPLENGEFKNDDFQSEKRLLVEHIMGEINDKRLYALSKTESAMYSGEPSGISRYGSLENAEKISNKDAVNALEKLLKTAFVRVNVVSQSSPNEVYKKIKSHFESLDRNVEKLNITKKHLFAGRVKNIEEKMDVTQGKLCMTFCVDTDETRLSQIKAQIFTDILGGGPYSKLFSNVREKQSLCYYCAARLNSQKSVTTVDSGILEENRQKAYDGIMEQLNQMKNGNISDDELKASKMSIVGSLRTITDLAANIDSWYCARVFDNGETIEKMIEYVDKITKEDVVKVAKSATLDTVYFLGSFDESKGENK